MTLEKKSKALRILEEAKARSQRNNTDPMSMAIDLLCYCLERFDEVELKVDKLREEVNALQSKK